MVREERKSEKRLNEKVFESDSQLRRALTSMDLVYLVIGSMIGSGWLFGSLYAASVAGPAAVISWVIGGALMLLIALVYAELGAMIHKSGASVRLPQYVYGGFASFILSWALLLSSICVPASEAEAAVTYMGSYIHGLVSGAGTLTGTGLMIALLFLVLFFLLNYFGIRLFGKVTTVIGWWKLVIPVLTVVLLLVFYLHPSNFALSAGGLARMDWAPVFLALPTTGIVYAYLGFRQVVDFAGEARNPQRDIPLSLILGFLIVMAIYVLLQVAFIGAIDWAKLGLKPGDWASLKYTVLHDGPFYQIMIITGIPILMIFAVFLLIDAIISPSGTGWIYIGTTARTFYGMAADGHLPDWFLRLNRWKIPWVSTVATFVISALFLIPYPAWVLIASLIVSLQVMAYAIGGPILVGLRRVAPNAPRPFRLPIAPVISAVAFIAAYLILYWATFITYWAAFVFTLAGFPLFYMYTMPNRYGVRKSYGIALGIAYWLVLAFSTYFLLYKPISEPLMGGGTLSLTGGVVMDYVAYVLITLALSVGFTAWLYRLANEEGKQHVRAGSWVLAFIFSLFVLTFLGSGNYGVSMPTVIPFPWDIAVVAIVGLAIHVYAAHSAIYTRDLDLVLKEANK